MLIDQAGFLYLNFNKMHSVDNPLHPGSKNRYNPA